MTGKYEKALRLPPQSACFVLNACNVSSNLFCAPPASPRMAPFDGSAWEEEDDEAPPPPDVPYYNNFPGKQPPPGGLIDMRTRPGATLVSVKRTVVEKRGKGWQNWTRMWQNHQYCLVSTFVSETFHFLFQLEFSFDIFKLDLEGCRH